MELNFKKHTRRLHFNGIEVVDLELYYEPESEAFLDYIAIFTSTSMPATIKSNMKLLSLKEIINLSFFNKDYFKQNLTNVLLMKLFSIVYKIDAKKNETKIDDIFVNKDIIEQKRFYCEVEKLQDKNTINVPVCVLLKYLEHRSSIKSNILNGGCDYGLKDLLNPCDAEYEYQDDDVYYNINIANFIKYNEDLIELVRVLKYILITTKLLKKFIKKNEILLIEKQTIKNQEIFIQRLTTFGYGLLPKDINFEEKYTNYGIGKFSISAIASCANIYSTNSNISIEEKNEHLRRHLGFLLTGTLDARISQLEKAILVLKKIILRESRNKTLMQRVSFVVKSRIFTFFRLLRPFFFNIFK